MFEDQFRISLSEDADATCSFNFTEYDQDLRVLRGCYEGLKSPKKVQKNTRNRPVRGDLFHEQLDFACQPDACGQLELSNVLCRINAGSRPIAGSPRGPDAIQ